VSKPGRRTGPCLHCTADKTLYARGLCWGCYSTPGVRDQYDYLDTAGRGVRHAEVTLEELDRQVEESLALIRANRPAWWYGSGANRVNGQRVREAQDAESPLERKARLARRVRLR